MKLHETERQLEADSCPLQLLAQLGQLSAEVRFTLQRTGPSLEDGPNTRTRDRHRPGSRSSEPQPSKASGSSTHPKRNNLNRSWSPSPRVSSELRASPLSFLDRTSSKEKVFRHILQQEQRLHDLQVLFQSLEREAALWELDSTSAPTPGPNPKLVEQLEEQLRQNEAELLLGEQREEELQTETDRERGTRSKLLTRSRFLPSVSDFLPPPHLSGRDAQTSAADTLVPGRSRQPDAAAAAASRPSQTGPGPPGPAAETSCADPGGRGGPEAPAAGAPAPAAAGAATGRHTVPDTGGATDRGPEAAGTTPPRTNASDLSCDRTSARRNHQNDQIFRINLPQLKMTTRKKTDPELMPLTIWCLPQDRKRMVDELNKELRQCKLQQFIQQSGGLQPDQTIPQQQPANVYLINAGILEQELPGYCTPRL